MSGKGAHWKRDKPKTGRGNLSGKGPPCSPSASFSKAFGLIASLSIPYPAPGPCPTRVQTHGGNTRPVSEKWDAPPPHITAWGLPFTVRWGSTKREQFSLMERPCYRKWLTLFSLKFQRDNRKKGLSRRSRQGENRKKAVFSTALWR